MILLTGSTGFVGGAVLSHLQNKSVRVVLRSLDVRPSGKFAELCQGSLHEKQDWRSSLAGIDVIVHCAARVHVMNEQASDPLIEFRRVNVEGTLRLAQQAAGVGVRRFVFVSSVKVNGEATAPGCPFEPDGVMAPQDPYAISKMEAEQRLRELSNHTGMELVIIRPPLVYGPGVKANFDSMMHWLKRGIPLPLGGVVNNRRSLVYVENLADLIRVCVDHPKAANQTFLVSDGEDVSTAALLRSISKALGCPARLVNIPPPLLELAAKLIGKPGIADRLCGSLQVDITKTKELLGWKPRFSLDEGLFRTALPMVNSCNN